MKKNNTNKTTVKQELSNSTKLNELSQKKKAFLTLFPETFGNITRTAKEIEIDRGTYYYWIRTDHDFKQAIEDLQPKRIIIDLAKSKLIEALEQGNITAIIFALKTLGKNEGFSEKTEIVNYNKDLDRVANMTDEELRAEIERLSDEILECDEPLKIVVESEEQKKMIESM